MLFSIYEYYISSTLDHRYPYTPLRCAENSHQNDRIFNTVCRIIQISLYEPIDIKAAVLEMLKNEKKITVNTGQVMFSGDIYYY